jgi:serine/threonine protein kinase
MELLHGCDLRHLLRTLAQRREQLPIEHALTVVLGVLAGLHHAHEHTDEAGRPLHLVHRDISPQNIFVTYEGGVKVLDFGIARTDQGQTRTGRLKGKPSYMSPEQARCEPVDRRTDVLASAIVLWELTTGQRLFYGDSDFVILKQVVETEARRPSRVAPDCPPELERIIMKGLRKRPDERWQTAEEMARAIVSFARDQMILHSPAALGRYMSSLFGDEKTKPRDGLTAARLVSVLAEPASARAPSRASPVRRRRRGWLLAALVSAVALGAAYAPRSRRAPAPKLTIAPGPEPEPEAQTRKPESSGSLAGGRSEVPPAPASRETPAPDTTRSLGSRERPIEDEVEGPRPHRRRHRDRANRKREKRARAAPDASNEVAREGRSKTMRESADWNPDAMLPPPRPEP